MFPQMLSAVPVLLTLSLLLPIAPTAHAQPTPDDLDAFWAEAARTVRDGDFAAYAALYHPDAVLVNGISETSMPIREALASWREGFEKTRSGEMEADVAFRFTRRIHSDSTAHEAGLFRYTSTTPGNEPSVAYIRFESLLIRTPDGWKWLMEYQTSTATEQEWTNASP